MGFSLNQFLKEAHERANRLTIFALSANEHFKSIEDIRTLYLEKRNVFDMASMFFQTTLEANYYYIFLGLNKMYCGKKKDDSALILLREMKEKTKDIFCNPFVITEFESSFSEESHDLYFKSLEDAVDIINKRIVQEKDTIDKVRNLRNKYYGHTDRNASKNYSELFEKNQVTVEDIDRLLNMNFTICNCIYTLLDQSTVMHDIVKMGSLDRLAKYAQIGIEAEKEKQNSHLQQLLNYNKDN